MEALPADLREAIFGWIPAHLYAVRCVCRAWRDLFGADKAKITRRTMLEVQDLDWLKALSEAVDWEASMADSLLHLAVHEGRHKDMRFARTLGATDIGTGLSIAAAKGDLTSIGMFLDWGGAEAEEAFNDAAEMGQVEAMDLLMKRCTFTQYKIYEALASAAIAGELEAMKYIFDASPGDLPPEIADTALAPAARNGRLEAMVLLKEQGATDFNKAFLAAAGAGEAGALELLKAWGATDLPGALEWAADAGQLSTITPLLERWALAEKSRRF